MKTTASMQGKPTDPQVTCEVCSGKKTVNVKGSNKQVTCFACRGTGKKIQGLSTK